MSHSVEMQSCNRGNPVRETRTGPTLRGMPLVSVITAVGDSALDFVDETWQSLTALALPAGYELQWCVQRDDPDEELATRTWAADERVSLGFSHRRGGASAARNQALLRARGDLVWSVDADDLVLPDALTTLAAPFEDPTCGWSGGAWLELPLDEARRGRFVPQVTGPVPVAWLGTMIQSTGTTPLSMNPLLYRRRAVISAGMWPAFHEWEDTLLAVGVSARWTGWVTDQVVGRYRRHPGQTTKTERFLDVAVRERMLALAMELAAV